MPTASPSTITPPRPHARPRPDDRKPTSRVAYAQFVDSNRHLFADYIARRLDGPHAGAAEDALQEGLIQIWNEWEHWPTDEQERIRFARQALRISALLAIRRRTGRDDSPRAGEIVVDFTTLDIYRDGGASPAAEGLAQELGRAIAQQSMVKDQLGYLEKASLIAAIATLTDLEQRVLFMTAQGDDCKQIAGDLGVTHQQAREALMRARRLCRMLIEHADGQKVSEKEAKMLWQYADGQLSGKRARELKRHIDHCTACKRLLGLEESIATNGALVILPIPVMLLAAGKALASSGAAAATGAGAASGAGATGAQLGGSLLAPAAPSTTFGSVLAGITAKASLALAGLAVTASVAGVYKLAHDRQVADARVAADARPATGAAHDALAPAAVNAPRAVPRRPPAHHAPRSPTTSRPSARSTASRARTTAKPARAQRAATTPPVANAARVPARTAANHTANTNGREFVIGG